jgi:hypothetical protein
MSLREAMQQENWRSRPRYPHEDRGLARFDHFGVKLFHQPVPFMSTATLSGIARNGVRLPSELLSDIIGTFEGSTRSRDTDGAAGAMRDVVEA